ncbi:hypothetical protein ACFWJT_15735 [Streptomyces sp. NPDC127069]|uniref:hypothetical protein n=1 Tax=Streptomyces sp. NPDC127069 TaxID=3347128 RepID=UPI003664F429
MPASVEELLAKAREWHENAKALAMAGHHDLARDCQIKAVSYEKAAANACIR